METLRVDLPLLLPDVPDACDACVRRLQDMVGAQGGISQAHVVGGNGKPAKLCLHYDPDVLPLAQVERLVRASGAQITERFGHAVLPVRMIDGEDAGRRVEDALRGISGVQSASVNIAAQRARVEFDRQLTSVEKLRDDLKTMGYAPASTPRLGAVGPGKRSTKQPDGTPATRNSPGA